MLVAPDTSPRGDGVPDDPAYDLGQGAGFYLDATQAPWSRHFKMRSYIADELPALLAASSRCAPAPSASAATRWAATARSCSPCATRTASAPSPPSRRSATPPPCPGASRPSPPTSAKTRPPGTSTTPPCSCAAAPLPGAPLIDQGEADKFLDDQLHPDTLARVCAEQGQPLTLRRHPGYDHSYFFIATFIADHIAHHARALTTL
jgi:S-formylglutathione hydrolase